MNERTCDFCQNANKDDFIYGRWIIYCEKCKDTGGRQADHDKTWENELSSDLENGDFSYIADDGELADILLGSI
jgi:hypothetical protein